MAAHVFRLLLKSSPTRHISEIIYMRESELCGEYVFVKYFGSAWSRRRFIFRHLIR